MINKDYINLAIAYNNCLEKAHESGFDVVNYKESNIHIELFIEFIITYCINNKDSKILILTKSKAEVRRLFKKTQKAIDNLLKISKIEAEIDIYKEIVFINGCELNFRTMLSAAATGTYNHLIVCFNCVGEELINSISGGRYLELEIIESIQAHFCRRKQICRYLIINKHIENSKFLSFVEKNRSFYEN